jgi:hypothetical protein
MKKMARILVLFLVLCLAFYYIINFIISSEQKKSLEAFENEIHLQTVVLSNTLWLLINSYVSDVNLITSFLNEKNAPPTTDDLKAFYGNILKPKMFLLNIAFLNNSGTQISIYPRKYSKSNGLNYSFSEYFKEVQKTGRIVISKALMNYRSEELVKGYHSINIIAPVTGLNKKKFGYLVFAIDILKLEELAHFKMHASGSNMSFYLVDLNNNEILCDSQPSDISEPLTGSAKFRSFLKNYAKTNDSKRGVLAEISDRKVFLSSTSLKIGRKSLAVVAMVPYIKSANYTADSFRIFFLISSYLALILFLIISFIVYHEVIVKRLRKKISRLEIIIDKKTKDLHTEEIVQTEYFKELTEKLKKIKK